jgi:serine/threonine protein kinase
MADAARRTYSEPPEPDVRRFGRYTLRYRVASGGMASVYLAQMAGSPSIRKWVAVKLIHPRMERDERFVKMFLHEAQILARLGHPNVCSLLDYGEEGGSPYIAMEYLHGESLASVVRRARIREQLVPFAIAARIVAEAARGLHAAHELKGPNGESAGVVHRDVSPQNVFVLYSGITKVVDFGIARSEDREDMTRTGELKGKFQYMAPEQINQDPLDRRADVFALGITLWELCAAGPKLFRRDRDLDTMLAVLNEPVPPITLHRPDAPAALVEIMTRALERDRDKRYATADDLARALGAFVTQAGGADNEAVGDFMRGLFEDRIVAREELLAKVQLDPSHIPVIEVESGSETATPAARKERRESETQAAKPRIVGSERPPLAPLPVTGGRGSSRMAGAIAVAVVVSVAAIVGVASMFATPEITPPAEPIAVALPPPPAPEPQAVAPEVVVAPPVALPVPAEPVITDPTPTRSRAARPRARDTAADSTTPPRTRETRTRDVPAGPGPHIMTDFESLE